MNGIEEVVKLREQGHSVAYIVKAVVAANLGGPRVTIKDARFAVETELFKWEMEQLNKSSEENYEHRINCFKQ
jgi:hypothetical protein